MNVEQRLSDALLPYREQVQSSLAVLERIEARTQRRHLPTRWIVVGALAVVAIAVGLATLSLRGGTDPDHLTAAAPTRQEFAAAADRLCADVEPKLANAVVVFPTATGVDVVARQLADVAQSMRAAVDATPAPTALRASLAALRADLTDAVDATDRARTAGNSGDLDGANVALHDAKTAIARVANRLVNEGARACAATAEVAGR